MQNEKRLTYKYRTQRDNKHEPYATCNVTALAMGLSCLGIEVDEDKLYEKANSSDIKAWAFKNIGSWTADYARANHLNQVWAVLEKLADDAIGNPAGATFKDNWLTIVQLVEHLDAGHPVLVGGLFTHGGHIICLVGYNSLGFICADPWGDWSEGYQNKNGENVLYFYDRIREVMAGKEGYYRALVLRK
jgi:uncharacterized protein YvpB